METTTEYDIDRLAYAIAMSETKNCRAWIWVKYNNCFWIKNGWIAPCSRVGKNNMCIYSSPSESYTAFKKIWKKVYKKFPNYKIAKTWTGNDKPAMWLQNVNYYYNKK